MNSTISGILSVASGLATIVIAILTFFYVYYTKRYVETASKQLGSMEEQLKFMDKQIKTQIQTIVVPNIHSTSIGPISIASFRRYQEPSPGEDVQRTQSGIICYPININLDFSNQGNGTALDLISYFWLEGKYLPNKIFLGKKELPPVGTLECQKSLADVSFYVNDDLKLLDYLEWLDIGSVSLRSKVIHLKIITLCRNLFDYGVQYECEYGLFDQPIEKRGNNCGIQALKEFRDSGAFPHMRDTANKLYKPSDDPKNDTTNMILRFQHVSNELEKYAESGLNSEQTLEFLLMNKYTKFKYGIFSELRDQIERELTNYYTAEVR